MRPVPGHFRNERRPFEWIEWRLFLKKKPLEFLLPVCSNSENALIAAAALVG
jgi:hypothetical protein